MIDAKEIREVIDFTVVDLMRVARDTGYYDEYVSSEFLGIQDDQFVFEVQYLDDENVLASGWVYVTAFEEGYELDY